MMVRSAYQLALAGLMALIASPSDARSFGCIFSEICFDTLYCETVDKRLIATDDPKGTLDVYAGSSGVLIMGDADLAGGDVVPKQFRRALTRWDKYLPRQPAFRNDATYHLGSSEKDGVTFRIGQDDAKELYIAWDGAARLTTVGEQGKPRVFNGDCRDII